LYEFLQELCLLQLHALLQPGDGLPDIARLRLQGLLEHGVVCAPGAFFGPAGEGYARFALVPTQEQCERAAAIIGEAL